VLVPPPAVAPIAVPEYPQLSCPEIGDDVWDEDDRLARLERLVQSVVAEEMKDLKAVYSTDGSSSSSSSTGGGTSTTETVLETMERVSGDFLVEVQRHIQQQQEEEREKQQHEDREQQLNAPQHSSKDPGVSEQYLPNPKNDKLREELQVLQTLGAKFKEEKALWEKALLESSPSSLLTSSISSGGEHVRYSTDVPVAAADTVNSADIEGSVSAATSGMSAAEMEEVIHDMTERISEIDVFLRSVSSLVESTKTAHTRMYRLYERHAFSSFPHINAPAAILREVTK
jgi:hypothetical protein